MTVTSPDGAHWTDRTRASAVRIGLRRSDADCRIIILTTFDLDQYVYAALADGASGFLFKDATAAELVYAVRVVAAGDALLAPSVTRRLVERFAPARLWSPRGAPGSVRAHPPRAGGAAAAGPRLSNAELAAQLTLSEATVKAHVSSILAKLQLSAGCRPSCLPTRPASSTRAACRCLDGQVRAGEHRHGADPPPA